MGANNTSNTNLFNNLITNTNNTFPNSSKNPFEDILKTSECKQPLNLKNVTNPFANNNTTSSIFELIKNSKSSASDEEYDTSDIYTSDTEGDNSQSNNI